MSDNLVRIKFGSPVHAKRHGFNVDEVASIRRFKEVLYERLRRDFPALHFEISYDEFAGPHGYSVTYSALFVEPNGHAVHTPSVDATVSHVYANDTLWLVRK